uniref:Stress responsive alpha-beta barrel domain protein n=1 Tax=Ipomoea pes-caprae TaxID=89656 RepID=A0A2Z4HND9_IPOPC|nr:stress responsive alpha-beta barrel domain protein [Ipomoea pes-caprae]
MSAKQIVEHVVLVRVKPDTEHSKVKDMVNNLSGLASLPQVLHLTTGPVLRTESPSLAFTHLLHARYNSASDLDEYNAHPLHLSAARTFLLPIIDDIMVVDWVSDDFHGSVEVSPGSIIRAKFLKLKENSGQKEKNEAVNAIKRLKGKFSSIDQLTVGENISQARTKGFSIASIGVFGGLDAVKELEAQSEALNDQKAGVNDFVDDVLVVDYAVPAKSLFNA